MARHTPNGSGIFRHFIHAGTVVGGLIKEGPAEGATRLRDADIESMLAQDASIAAIHLHQDQGFASATTATAATAAAAAVRALKMTVREAWLKRPMSHQYAPPSCPNPPPVVARQHRWFGVSQSAVAGVAYCTGQ